MHGPIQTRETISFTHHNTFAFFEKMRKINVWNLKNCTVPVPCIVALSSQPGGSSSSESDSGRKAGKRGGANIKGILSRENKSGEKSLIAGLYHDGTVEFLFYFNTIRTSFTIQKKPHLTWLQLYLTDWEQMLFLRCTDSYGQMTAAANGAQLR
jgi:hypothetical protein